MKRFRTAALVLIAIGAFLTSAYLDHQELHALYGEVGR